MPSASVGVLLIRARQASRDTMSEWLGFYTHQTTCCNAFFRSESEAPLKIVDFHMVDINVCKLIYIYGPAFSNR